MIDALSTDVASNRRSSSQTGQKSRAHHSWRGKNIGEDAQAIQQRENIIVFWVVSQDKPRDIVIKNPPDFIVDKKLSQGQFVLDKQRAHGPVKCPDGDAQ